MQRQSASNADALALPTAKGMRIAAHILGLQTHPFEQGGDLVFEILAAGQTVDFQRLPDNGKHILRGFNEAYGSWKIMRSSRRYGCSSYLSNVARST